MAGADFARYSRMAVVAVMAWLVVVVLASCSSPTNDQKTPANFNTATLDLTVSPAKAPADGTTVDLSVVAKEADGTPGVGDVVVSVDMGTLDGDPSLSKTVTLANGRVSLKYACDMFALKKSACVSAGHTVTAQWKSLTKKISVEFTNPVGDGGTDGSGGTGGGGQDASVDADASQDTGTSDTRAEVGTDADAGVSADTGPDTVVGFDAAPEAQAEASTARVVSLTTNRPKIFLDVGDYSDLTATLRIPPDGGVVAGEIISFSTNLGALVTPDSDAGWGDAGAVFSAVTNSSGIAVARFIEVGQPGWANITATHPVSGASAQVSIDILTVQQITHVSTMCGGQACTIMGIKGSGFNEQAQVTYKIVDSGGNAVPGITVNFSITNPPGGTTVTPTGVTDSQGRVTANVSAGPSIGAFTVKAVVIPNMVETDSPTIGIRGAKAANHGFAMRCNPVNVAAYYAASRPAKFDVNCDVKVVDRYNNPVGTGTSVNFKVEAGSMTNSIATKKYDPAGSNNDEGTGQVVFSTFGGTWPASDVDPLPAVPTQWPSGRDPEPSWMDGALQRNPRDGLVTVLAYLRGEEFFQDDNGNGTWDSGEQFVDQGEPFVDANDNGVRDQGEVFIDEAPNNGQWDPPNGVWDKNTTIWTEARILYTDVPRDLPTHSYVDPSNFGMVLRGSSVFLDAYFADLNFNRVQAPSTYFTVEHTAGKGQVTWVSGTLADGYGFGMERRLVDATTKKGCVPATPVCEWRILFYNWGKGLSGQAKVQGAPVSDTSLAQPDTVTIKATVGIVTPHITSIAATGTIQ